MPSSRKMVAAACSTLVYLDGAAAALARRAIGSTCTCILILITSSGATTNRWRQPAMAPAVASSAARLGTDADDWVLDDGVTTPMDGCAQCAMCDAVIVIVLRGNERETALQLQTCQYCRPVEQPTRHHPPSSACAHHDVYNAHPSPAHPATTGHNSTCHPHMPPKPGSTDPSCPRRVQGTPCCALMLCTHKYHLHSVTMYGCSPPSSVPRRSSTSLGAPLQRLPPTSWCV